MAATELVASVLPKSLVDEARARMAALLPAGGVAACQAMSDALDGAVQSVVKHLGPLSGVALVATGGWGRRDTCPRSDIDLLVLTDGPPDDSTRVLAERILYPLWDAGIEVGHAVRSVDEAASLAAEDLATMTALLDARLLEGEGRLATALGRALPVVLARLRPNDLVNRLIAEKQSRHARFGDSLYLLEPNLKHGQGGLRDLTTGLWAARARWRVGDFADLVSIGQATARQAAALTSARDLLLQLRGLCHVQARRRQDQLTFELQEAVAPVLYPQARARAGEVRAAVAPAVEELMRRFYLAARAVVVETDRLLERALVPAQRRPVILKLDPSFVVWNGKLSVTDPQVFRDAPAEMIRLFQVALEHKLPIYGHTREVVAERVAVDAPRLASDHEAHEAQRIFVGLLTDPRDARQPSLLEEMHDVGLLSALMPEFGPCTGRVQHDLYHVYTVDQHQLYAVALMKRLGRGELAREAPSPTKAYQELASRRALYLGTLLHDVGKPLGKGHSEKGARLAVSIARRLGLTKDEVARVEFLVRHHLLMSHLSQRRDLDDVTLIEKFARVVETEETLRELYLLTYCDTAMTAPGNLSEWKATLLRELYDKTKAYLRRGPDPLGGDQPARVAARRRSVAEHLGEPVDAVGAWLDPMPDRYVGVLGPRSIAEHIRLARTLGARPAALHVSRTAKKGVSEVLLAARDRKGLLASAAGVFLANRVDVLGAQIYSRPAGAPVDPGLALDVFQVRDSAGRAIPASDPRWQRIEADLVHVLGDEEPVAELVARRRQSGSLPRRVLPHVPTEIEIDNDVSEKLTVIDVYTHDRPGVLWAIAQTLTDLGLDISFSRVATEAQRVADVFYVRRVDDPAALRDIDDRLRAALAAIPA